MNPEHHRRILLVGSDLQPPPTTMEAVMGAALRDALTNLDWSVLTVRVSGQDHNAPPFRTVAGFTSGPVWLRKLTYLPAFLTGFAKELRRRPHVVHLLWVGFSGLTPLAVQWARAAGARVVVTVLDRHTPPSRYRGADAIVVHSEDTYQLYRQAGIPAQRLHRIPPPVDLDRFRPVETRVRSEVLMLSGPRTAAQIRVRGVQLAFQAFALLERRGVPVRLTLLNRWPQGEQALERIREHTGAGNVFIEHGYREDVAARLGHSLALLVPFTGRGTGDLPLSAAEAWACGRPVIATRGYGLDSLLADGSAGQLCDPTPSSLASAIELIHDSPPSTWHKSALRLAANFDRSSFAPRMADVYLAGKRQ